MDSGMQAVVENYITALFNSGYSLVNWTTYGLDNTDSLIDPNYALGTNETTFNSSGSPRYNALKTFAAGVPLPTRNLVSGSGSIVDCQFMADQGYTDSGFLNGSVSGQYPYFGQLNAYFQGPYYGTTGYSGYLINCTAPATYAMSVYMTTTTTGSTNVEVNGAVLATGKSIASGLSNALAFTQSVTLKQGPNYVLLGNGTNYTGVVPKSLRFN
jgi:hypothetical protein